MLPAQLTVKLAVNMHSLFDVVFLSYKCSVRCVNSA